MRYSILNTTLSLQNHTEMGGCANYLDAQNALQENSYHNIS